MFKKLSIICSVLLLTGCESFTAERYVVSSTNQAALQNLGKQYNVLNFDVADEKTIDVACRMAGPIQVAGDGSHTEYIRRALIDELQAVGAYNPSSSKVFTARLNKVSVTTISPASWTISGDFYLNGQLLKTVETEYGYKTSYSAYGACNNAADNFPYAVEEFIGTFIKSDEFKQTAQ